MNRYMAEFVGTFVLVVGGCGSAVLAGDKIGYLGRSLASGCRCWRWSTRSGRSPAATSIPQSPSGCC